MHHFSRVRKIIPRPWNILYLLCIASFLLAGCIEPGQQFNHDIVVVKLHDDGSPEWSKTFDTGNNPMHDAKAHSIIQTDDGSLVVFALFPDLRNVTPYPRADTLIRFSRTGEVAWELPLYPRCGADSITAGKNDEIVTVATTLCRVDSGGTVVWEHTPDFYAVTGPDQEPVGTVDITSLIGTDDGGYLVGGASRQTVASRLDRAGNVTWATVLDDTVPPIWIFEPGVGRGYLVQTSKDLIMLDNSGNITGSVWLKDPANLSASSEVKTIEGTFNVSFPYALMHDARGVTVAFRPLQNQQNASTAVIGTADGGYVSAGFRTDQGLFQTGIMHKVQEGGLHVVKLHPDGTVEWDVVVPNVSANIVNQVIQTSDGGFAILCENEKFPY